VAVGSDVWVDPREIGHEIYALIEELYPICRSITGDGFRKTMGILQRHVPLQVYEVPSGTRVFDWTVPREWNIRDAYVKDGSGNRVIDFQKSNLHVVSYSTPIRQVMPLESLRPHLFTLPDHPDWIPYRTSYYRENWGFCLSDRDYRDLNEGEYEVLIDSTLDDGYLTYGELHLPGREKAEILISCHACHPSLCNDNLSGVAIATMLARQISMAKQRYSYRFLFIPGTIGAITWLARNEDKVPNIRHGLVLSGLGDPGGLTYKKSRRGDAEIDRVVCHVLRRPGSAHGIFDFDPYGYDERQYCSPGFDLPMGRLSRTPYGTYPEYHTSADNLSFIRPGSLGDSFDRIREVFDVLESNRAYVNLSPKCEPQLGKRGLYASVGEAERALLWVLNMSDGGHDLLSISDRSGMEFVSLREAAQRLVDADLLRLVRVDCGPTGLRMSS
jgi:aminopeptidase-like protein